MVSVIIPCFDQGAYLQEAIDSVKAQTYTDWEIIIVNDGSGDEQTKQLLGELKGQGYHIIDMENSGVSVARNTGIKAAAGEFILPLDADDKLGPGYLEEAVKVLTEYPSIKLVYCECEYFGTVNGKLELPAFSIEGMLSENLIFNSAVFKKADFLKTDGYDPLFLTGWEDWEFWLRFIENDAAVYKLPGTHFFYRRKDVSRNSTLTAERLQFCEQQLFKKHIERFLEKYPNPIYLLKQHAVFKTEAAKFEDHKMKLYSSNRYRLGNFLLAPLKWFKK